jgi:hypothetical protein
VIAFIFEEMLVMPEGVGTEALLIDKDKQPKWNPATLAEAAEDWVEKFFTLPFAAEQHPLSHLGLNHSVG